MRAQCLGMMTFTELPSVPSDHPGPLTDQLRLAVAAYLARFKGASRYHTESDLRCYLAWCAERGLDPLTARAIRIPPPGGTTGSLPVVVHARTIVQGGMPGWQIALIAAVLAVLADRIWVARRQMAAPADIRT